MSGAAGQVSWDLRWDDDFIVIEPAVTLLAALRQLDLTDRRWVIVRRFNGLMYVFSVDELWNWPPLAAARERGGDALNDVFEAALDLHETMASSTVPESTRPHGTQAPPYSAATPSVGRLVALDRNGRPASVGIPSPIPTAEPPQPEVLSTGMGATPASSQSPAPAMRGGTSKKRSRPPAAGEQQQQQQQQQQQPGAGGGEQTQQQANDVGGAPQAEPEDEGTRPVRYPSIDVDQPLLAGASVTFTIDLVHVPVAHTQGGAINVGELASNWEKLALGVVLFCPQIDFEDDGRGSVTIRRNQASLAAAIKGRVKADVKAGQPHIVMATFFDGSRYCGNAMRMFQPTAAGQDVSINQGAVAAEPGAAAPDLTVHISKVAGSEVGLDWLVVTAERFDGLPPKLREQIDLGQSPAAEANALFAEFAQLPRGQHRDRIEGFGSRLWLRAPAMFRAVYWALWDRYRRPLAIQFVSDDPHIPWELMRPARADESEIHPPLALAHCVARWISRWDGYMRNRLPGGGICTIAPKYKTLSRQLPRAQQESDALVERFHAQRIDGTTQAVKQLLRTAPPPSPVGVLHFAGHGAFAAQAASGSAIKLEDGDLGASEVERPEVQLGRACHTLVFFNACQVGASGSIFGEVGGWADAFLGRQFGGFIAPLWSVDDTDAGVVATELLDGIVTRHEPIGEVLRSVRAKHGDESPSFFSYLYYGDVTAKLAA